jgi:hypothetical protein
LLEIYYYLEITKQVYSFEGEGYNITELPRNYLYRYFEHYLPKKDNWKVS